MHVLIRVFLFVALSLSWSYSTGQDISPIIPRPLHFSVDTTERFMVDRETTIYVAGNDIDLKAIAKQLSDEIQRLTGIRLSIAGDGAISKDNRIVLDLKNEMDSLGEEGYTLKATADEIVISGKTSQGVFYGAQSLFQLFGDGSAWVPLVEIYDIPRFAWRGFMLDVARYFYSVDFIKKTIDNLARYKMNVFHWHLVDDQGWRIEIKKYPELTSKGAWREETQFIRGGSGPRWVRQDPHGGYYTQEQIKEVVAYAQSKFVTVIPEIEMPGHTLSSLAVFPELSCTGGPFTISGQWRIEKNVYCAGNEHTFQFLEDVLTEVAELFPSELIHIGGDECPKDRWQACSKCQERIKREGLKDEDELQSYFIKRIEKFLLTKGKNIIGWDEILEGGLAPNAMVMSWRGIEGGIEAARQGHDIVMSPTSHMYFDYYQGERHMEPYANGAILPIHRVYSFDPIPKQLNEKEAQHVKGVQANLWTVFSHSVDRAEYMTFPRIAAVAEVGWTASDLMDWKDFSRRIENDFTNYERLGVNYARSIYNVWYETKIDSTAHTARVELKAYNYEPEIRYTTDGTEPTANAALYTGPFNIKLPATVKSATFKNGKRLGKVNDRTLVIIDK